MLNSSFRHRAEIQGKGADVVYFPKRMLKIDLFPYTGYCTAIARPYITLHAEDIIHPLKEVDADAMA